jgi:hypothetical protein
MAVEMIPGKDCDFSIYLAKRGRAQSEHAQSFSFLIMEQCYFPLAVEMFPGNHWDFSTYLDKRVRAQSGACAEVQFLDFGT